MNKPRISVLMGIYNCAPTLAEALDSLLAQTYQGFKVIMCDDGSTDDTFKVAQEYVNRYPGKFILIQNKMNLKLAATLNRCLELADTEYCARMDGDDISLPERFEKEINFLDNHSEYSVVSCPMYYFDEKGVFKTGVAGGEPPKEVFLKRTPFCHAPCMIRTEVYKAVGGYTDKPITVRREDYYLWYKIYRMGYRGFNLSEPLYKMRDNRKARARRMSVKNRVNAAKCVLEVARGLGLKHAHRYALIDILKILLPLLPYSLYKYLRK